MMAWTDRHCRYFLRQLTRHARLYTEMVTTGAVLHGDTGRLLAFDEAEHPVALQLGGSDPAALAAAARIGAEFGYDEINLNVGCPSDRVHAGRFGACLMAEPGLVADCVAAMAAAAALPVTVKTRIGIDAQDSYAFLANFVEHVVAAGCRTVIIHARKAILGGLSPADNRRIPPLDHARVYRLKQDHPDLEVVINGGVSSLDAAAGHLERVDGVMLGRAAYRDPWLLADVDPRFHGTPRPAATRAEVVMAMQPYIEAELERGTALKQITRHMTGLYRDVPGARTWRRCLGQQPGGGAEFMLRVLERTEEVMAGATTRAEDRLAHG